MGWDINRRIRERFSRVRQEFYEHKPLFILYVVIRLLVLITMALEIQNQAWYNVFLCVITLVLLLIPSFVERRIRIDIPDVLEAAMLIFIFAAEILGELQEYYLAFPYWDTMLHTVNGFLCAAIGLALIDILNNSPRFSISLSPVFVALSAFCFSMTIGVIWEFLEYGMDVLFATDAQKDTIVTSISSVLLNPDGHNLAITVPVESVVINGEEWLFGGYVDIGLIDTIHDLMVNFIGATLFSVFGYFYVKNKGEGGIVAHLMLTKMQDEPKEPE
ncbi:MAG: hypothetical protein LBO07_01525 [Coriobacteriales bacterium]|jgi:hypothetical protein|nr:hypothetical protein [Coriobacteriales bacterium]